MEEINAEHQKTNGELRKELEDKTEKLKIATAMLTKGTYPAKNDKDNDFDCQFISKDKIKSILDKQYELWNTPNRQKEYNVELVEILESLLED
jgi:hypothetical protein